MHSKKHIMRPSAEKDHEIEGDKNLESPDIALGNMPCIVNRDPYFENDHRKPHEEHGEERVSGVETEVEKGSYEQDSEC